MAADDVSRLRDSINVALAPHGFRDAWRPSLSGLRCADLWRLRTWNLNHAVALVEAPPKCEHVGRFCQSMKWRLLRRMWFVPVFYEVGIQIVVCGDGLERGLDGPEALQPHVDLVSNQLVVLQSIFAADTATRRCAAARSWMHAVTGKYHDAIWGGIRAAGFESSLGRG